MPRTKRLTAKQTEYAEPGKHADGGGLTLVVTKKGTRSWVVRLTIDGKQRDFGIGGYPNVSLADARLRAAQLRAEVLDGGDPAADRKGPEVPTFGEAAEATHAMLLPSWRNAQHAEMWLRVLRKHAEPLWPIPVDRVTRADVLAVLEPIWHDKPETARRVRQRIRRVMSWATARFEHILGNPAGEVIDGALVAMPKVKAHQRALHWSEVPSSLRAIDEGEACDASKLALRFLVLTWARSGEVREARWREIEGDVWRVPSGRMKAGVEHRVPLSRQALDVLAEVRKLGDGKPDSLIFPSPLTGRPLAAEALLKVLRTAQIDSTAHGYRSAGRTWALEQTSTPFLVAEAALAHRLGSDEQVAYMRSDLFEQRSRLMADWADYVTA